MTLFCAILIRFDIFAPVDAGFDKLFAARPVQASKTLFYILKYAIFIIGILILGSMIYSAVYYTPKSPIFYAGIITAVSLIAVRWFSAGRTTVSLIVVGILLINAYAFGVEMGASYLRSPSADYQIETENGTINAKLIRAGERGVLFYSPSEKRLMFGRWETIKGITEAWK